MKVNTVDNNSIEIVLSDDEVTRIFGGYSLIDYNTPDCRIKIHNLLAAVIPEALLPLDCERILIEVKPHKSGCSITLTKVYIPAGKHTRKYRLCSFTMIFENSENMIYALPVLSKLNVITSNLYSFEGKYAISAAIRDINGADLMKIREFCIVTQNTADAAKLNEYWRCITYKNAIQKLANAFLK